MALTRPRLGQLNTNVVATADPITVLNQGATQANVDVGFLFNRANGLVSNVALYWSEATQSIITAYTTNSGTTNANVSVASYANLTVGNVLLVNGGILGVVGNLSLGNLTVNNTITTSTVNASIIGNTGATLTGTLSKASQPNITGVGTITSGTWSSSFGAVSGSNLTNLTAANLLGTAPTANVSLYDAVTALTTNQTFYPQFSNIATTGNTIMGVSPSLAFNPSTGTLNATTVVASTVNAATIGNTGALLTGTLQTASQPNITGVGTITSGTWSSSFGAVSGANLTNLTAANLLGTAPTANVSLYDAVTALTTNQTFYPQFSNIATTGNTIMGVSPSLAYNPSTGTLNTTTVVATTINAATIGNTGAVLYGTLNSSSASQPNVTTLAGLTSFGTAGVTTIAQGNLSIAGNLTVTGNSVSIGASTLSITDPIINLNTPSDLTPLSTPTTADIGLKFHYYDSADSAAFLGRENTSGTLVWWARGTDTANVFTGTVYGNIKTGSMLLANTTTSTGTTSGALQVAGGAGIAGAIYAGSIQNTPIGSTTASTGAFTTGTFSSTLGVTGATTLTTATTGGLQAVAIGNVTPGTAQFTTLGASGASTLNTVTGASFQGIIGNVTPAAGTFTTLTNSGVLTSSGNIVAASGTSSTSTTTGALVVAGGAGISGNVNLGANLYVSTITTTAGSNGNLTIDPDGSGELIISPATEMVVQSTVSSTSTGTGALMVLGGVGIAGNAYVNALYTTNGLFWASNNNVISTGGGGSAPAGSTGQVQYNNDGVLGATNLYYFTGNSAHVTTGNITAANIIATSNTQAVNTTTGAVQLTGGVSIATGNLYIGGSAGRSITAAGNLVVTGSASTTTTTGAIVVSGGIGVSGQITATTLSGTLSTAAQTSVTSVGTLTGLSVSGITTISSATTSASITTGALVLSGAGGGLGLQGNVFAGGNVYVRSRVGYTYSANSTSAVYQVYNQVTNSLDTVFG